MIRRDLLPVGSFFFCVVKDFTPVTGSGGVSYQVFSSRDSKRPPRSPHRSF